MARKARSDKGKKRVKKGRGKKQQPKVLKTRKPRKQRVVKSKKEEVTNMAKDKSVEIDEKKYPTLAALTQELIALFGGEAPVAEAEEAEEAEEEEEEKPKAKAKAKADEEEEEDEDDDDEDEDEDEDEEEKEEESESEDEDEIELDLNKIDSMDTSELREIAGKIGIKKYEKMKEKELRAAILEKVKEEQGDEDEDEDEESDGPGGPSSDDEDEDGFKVGDKVKGLWPKDKKYYNAVVTKVLPKGEYEIKWNEGGKLFVTKDVIAKK